MGEADVDDDDVDGDEERERELERELDVDLDEELLDELQVPESLDEDSGLSADARVVPSSRRFLVLWLDGLLLSLLSRPAELVLVIVRLLPRPVELVMVRYPPLCLLMLSSIEQRPLLLLS